MYGKRFLKKKINDENKYSKVFFCVSVKIRKDIKG